MNTLVAVMCHAQGQDILDRHLPLFEQHGLPMVLFCPADAVVNPRGHHVWAYGTRSHHDAMANRRFKELLKMLVWTSFHRFVIFEADALCLGAIPVFFEWDHSAQSVGGGPAKDWDRPFICGNVFHDNGPDRKFKGSTFIHPPLIFTDVGLSAILPHLDALPDDAEYGFWDRYLGLACENAGIEPMDFMSKGLGYAENTILWDSQAHDAAADGRIFFHGCKHETVLKAILAGHELAKATGKLRHGLEIPI